MNSLNECGARGKIYKAEAWAEASSAAGADCADDDAIFHENRATAAANESENRRKLQINSLGVALVVVVVFMVSGKQLAGLAAPRGFGSADALYRGTSARLAYIKFPPRPILKSKVAFALSPAPQLTGR